MGPGRAFSVMSGLFKAKSDYKFPFVFCGAVGCPAAWTRIETRTARKRLCTVICVRCRQAEKENDDFVLHGLHEMARNMYAAGGCVGEGMRDAASVADDIEPFVPGLQLFVHLNLYIVKFYFHTVQKGVIIRRTGRDLVQGVDHLNDPV